MFVFSPLMPQKPQLQKAKLNKSTFILYLQYVFKELVKELVLLTVVFIATPGSVQVVGSFSLWISVAFQTVMTEYYVLFVIIWMYYPCCTHSCQAQTEIHGFLLPSVIIHICIIISVATCEALSGIISANWKKFVIMWLKQNVTPVDTQFSCSALFFFSLFLD